MTDALKHRGPDGSGLFANDRPWGSRYVGLGHRRLAILDLSPAAAQPMTDESGRFTIVHNGEVFNYRDLRDDLRRDSAASFNSSGDTEVVLKAWAKWGTDAPRRFVGFFAFAIWDALERRLYLCRDRLGIKGIYYTEGAQEFAFASELRSLVRGGAVKQEIEPRAVDGYLAFGSVQEPWTIFKRAFALPPATIMTVDADSLKTSTSRYWEDPFAAGHDYAEPDAERLAELLQDAIRRRLISDVPLGVFLSGGVDSSCVVAAASRFVRKPLRTFTLDFDDPGVSESQYADLVAKRFGTDHTRHLLTEEQLYQCLPAALRALDQPTFDGLNSYFVCKVAEGFGYPIKPLFQEVGLRS